jgi:alpha-aminoadipic semialdehyde synthase
MNRIGIRREDKNLFERRVPLTPEHVGELTGRGIPVTVQPAPRRVFDENAFRAAGADVDESLDGCEVVMGVKEIPVDRLARGKTYVFFSHTIKGQPYNMAMLARLLELGCTLIDYERVVDDQDRRLVFFGRHAGLAGMIDTLWALGQRLAHVEGLETPLADLRQAFGYDGLAAAKRAIAAVGAALSQDGVPPAVAPLVCGFAGYGNVSAGAQEIYDLLEPEEVSPAELASVDPDDRSRCYKVVFREEHLVDRGDGSPFELQRYYDHPEAYRPVFAERHLASLTLLVNCIYWTERYPRLVTLDDLRALYGEKGRPRLRVIGDISCDIDGSVEATVKATEPDRPVFVYDLDRGAAVDGVAGHGPVIMAVDNLPAELPRDASESFSSALLPLVPALAAADLEAPTLASCGLPAPLERAVIVYRGELAPDYRYLDEHLARQDP